MKYFIDTEFWEHSDKSSISIHPISLGIVTEGKKELYLQFLGFHPQLVSPWLQENVLPHLLLCPHARYFSEHTVFGDYLYHLQKGQCTFEGELAYAYTDCYWRTHEQVQREIQGFIGSDDNPEFIMWCGSYDYTVICQIFGGMMSLPQGWPHSIIDIQNILNDRKITDDQLPPQTGTMHNALEDARHIKRLWEWLHA